MLFFVVCACFALFPSEVLSGAQNGLALCINAVIPSLLPFMLISSCVIKSGFSVPLGRIIGKILTPLTGVSEDGCICFITGLLGGYGAGARAVYEIYEKKRVSKKEAQRLIAFCNNAGPLFVSGTIGMGFFSDKSIGAGLFIIQVMTAVICAFLLSLKQRKSGESIRRGWDFYKKNKPPLGELITTSAVDSGGAIINACVFVITFSAVLEILPFEKYSLLAGFLEVTRAAAELSRKGREALPLISAVIAWGGMSVHFQASALCKGAFDMKIYYMGKLLSASVAYAITKIAGTDFYVLMFLFVILGAVMLTFNFISVLFCRECTRQHGFRQQPHS